MPITLNSFINQAVTLGEKSDKAITVQDGGDAVTAIKISSSDAKKAPFKTINTNTWNVFKQKLIDNFGQESITPQFEKLRAENKPLTTRAIMQLTQDIQDNARTFFVSKLTNDFERLGAEDAYMKDSLLKDFSAKQVLDTYKELSHRPNFNDWQPIDRLEAVREKLLENTARTDYISDANPTGLSSVTEEGTVFGQRETSIEDLTKCRNFALKKGDAIGTITGGTNSGQKKFIYVGLKEKGVEPGFLVTKNWLPSHELALKGQSGDENPIYREALGFIKNELVKRFADVSSRDAAMTLLQLEKYMPAGEEKERIYANFAQKTVKEVFETVNAQENAVVDAGQPAPQSEFREILKNISDQGIENFAKAILSGQDSLHGVDLLTPAKVHVKATLPEFTTRHVIKLDYNESDRGTFGELRLPQRIKDSHGKLFHHFRTTNMRDANKGALSEALANDITRMLGVPAQKLEIVKGQYSNGAPKLMLDSTYITGQNGATYRDFDHFIRDGYLDKDLLKATGHSGDIKNLGAFKACFLLLGDRDAVGSKGQNKGFVGNTFAAIDPGHSLEGNTVNVADDFSFTYKSTAFGAAFLNFSVFDDCTLSEKMSGWDAIEKAVEAGDIERLFDSYKANFGTNSPDKKLNFTKEIAKMEKEFTDRFNSMKRTLQPRLDMYRENPALLTTLENVEKLFSTTSETSPNATVALEHLRVTDRVACDMSVERDNTLTLRLRNPKQVKDFDLILHNFLEKNNKQDLVAMVGNEITVFPGQVEEFMRVFDESNVKAFKRSLAMEHPE